MTVGYVGPSAPVRPRLPPDRELQVRRPAGLTRAAILQVEGLREVLEQALAAAEGDRRNDDVEFVDDAGVGPLADHVGPASDAHVLRPGSLFRAIDRLLEAADEG